MDLLASFRDPSGSCRAVKGRIIRTVDAPSAAELDGFLATACAKKHIEAGSLVTSTRLGEEEQRSLELAPPPGGAVYEHPFIKFPSYPHEWPPEMFHAAGQLTAELALDALADGYGLKDATPFNILFVGARPVFVDVCSFERRAPDDAIWRPYAQFVRTFLLPLLAHRAFGQLPSEVFLAYRDGLEPESVYRLCGTLRRLTPPFLGLVSFPVWLGGKKSEAQLERPQARFSPEKARFILSTTLRRLPRLLDRVAGQAVSDSKWSDYMQTLSYTEAEFAEKEAFVKQALAEAKSTRVLDVGANTGHFSALAAESGASVVAIDYDAACLGRIWRRARSQKLDILPLIVNFARPTPALGWRNGENASFLDRARGHFDMVFMLAVLHHLLVTDRVPMAMALDLAAEITTRDLIIEFVGPEDPMFRRIARGREALHKGDTVEAFEKACAARFVILRSQATGDGRRRLYWLRRKDVPA